MADQQRDTGAKARDQNLSSILGQIKDDGPAGIDEAAQVAAGSSSYVRLSVAGSSKAGIDPEPPQAPHRRPATPPQRRSWRRALGIFTLFAATAALASVLGYLGAYVGSAGMRSAISSPAEDARDGLQDLRASVGTLTERVDGISRERERALRQVEQRIAVAEQSNREQLLALEQRLTELGGLDAKLGLLAARLDRLISQLGEDMADRDAPQRTREDAVVRASDEEVNAGDSPVIDSLKDTALSRHPLHVAAEPPQDLSDTEPSERQGGIASLATEVQQTQLAPSPAPAPAEPDSEVLVDREPETVPPAEHAETRPSQLARITPSAQTASGEGNPVALEQEAESHAESAPTLRRQSAESSPSAPSASDGEIARAREPAAYAWSEALVSDRVVPSVRTPARIEETQTSGRGKVPRPAPDGEKKAIAKQWAINLIALSNKAKAQQLKRDYAANGVDVELIEMRRSRARGKLFGLRIPGFTTRQDAVAFSVDVKRRLGINEVWIYAY